MSNKQKGFTYAEMETVAVVVEEITDWYYDPNKEGGKLLAYQQVEKYREDKGSADMRNSLIYFCERLDTVWNTVVKVRADEQCEGDTHYLVNGCWDFEWIPTMVAKAALVADATGDNWFDCSTWDLEAITEVIFLEADEARAKEVKS